MLPEVISHRSVRLGRAVAGEPENEEIWIKVEKSKYLKGFQMSDLARPQGHN